MKVITSISKPQLGAMASSKTYFAEFIITAENNFPLLWLLIIEQNSLERELWSSSGSKTHQRLRVIVI